MNRALGVQGATQTSRFPSCACSYMQRLPSPQSALVAHSHWHEVP